MHGTAWARPRPAIPGWNVGPIFPILESVQSKDSSAVSALVDRIRRLAWDVDFSEETIALYPEWTLQRVLEYGQWEDYEALARYFGPQRLRELLGRVHCSIPRARSFCEAMCA